MLFVARTGSCKKIAGRGLFCVFRAIDADRLVFVIPSVVTAEGGSACPDTGILIAPSTRASVPSAGLSFALPPSFAKSVRLGSSESVIVDPGVAEPLSVKTRWATRSPGAAFAVKGIGVVDS